MQASAMAGASAGRVPREGRASHPEAAAEVEVATLDDEDTWPEAQGTHVSLL